MPTGDLIQRPVDSLLLPRGGLGFSRGSQIVAATAYFVYLGHIKEPITIQRVYTAAVGTVGSGTQTAEIGLFSTPDRPNRSGQTLTKIVASGSVDSFTSNGPKRNTSAFAQLITPGTFLWAGIRISLTGTQPRVMYVCGDRLLGYVLTLAGAGALTASSTFSGSVPALTTDFLGFLAPTLVATTF